MKITWPSLGTISSITGRWIPGTTHSVTVLCDIQPASGAYLRKSDGATLEYSWKVFADPFDEASSVPENATLTFFSVEHVLVQLFEYQKHVELKCRD